MTFATLEPGDCRDVMLEMAARGEVFDSIVCDPPYDLVSTVQRFGSATAAPAKSNGATGVYARASRGFMGKTWDGTGVAFDPRTWQLAFDVVKPGAHLLAFGGTRTFHRMAVAIEDAGFEIRDCLMWLYGTGFPKSRDMAKAIDKESGAAGSYGDPKSAAHAGWIERGRMRGDQNEAGWQRPWMDDPAQVNNAARQYLPATDAARQWSGWGTALKPAWEPIIVARKPIAGTVAGNVQAHGTGALNIDGCRIALPDGDALHDGVTHDGAALDTRDGQAWGFKAVDRAPGLGRWPANVIHDGSPEVMDAFAAYGERKTGGPGVTKQNTNSPVYSGPASSADRLTVAYADTGTAARFFYSAKATARDRAGSKHPTVKPLALMRYLCRLVTPPGGAVLDPFAGSGSTLQAAVEEGFRAVGIEQDAEYQADILRRIAALEAAELAALCA